MMVFICEACRSGEKPIFPDCCRTSEASAREAMSAEFDVRAREAAENGDLRAIIELWHAGFDLASYQRDILNEALLGNRAELLAKSYEFIGRAA